MKRILIIHRSSLGDFLLLLPSLAALRSTFPEMWIEAMGRTDILSLICPGVADSAISIERRSLLPFFEDGFELPESEKGFFASFDAVLAYISDPEKIFERNLAGLGIKHLVVRPPFPPLTKRWHVADYLYDTVARLVEGQRPADSARTFGARETFCRLNFSEAEVEAAEYFLKFPGATGHSIVAIHPGSGSAKKCWPADRFEELAGELKARGFEILFILGPADERMGERISNLATELNALCARSLPLRRLGAILSRCSAYIGNDSGVTHLAAAVGIPVAGIFGPTDPAIWSPVGTRVTLVRSDADCSPCSRREMRICRDQVCLRRVNLQTVLEAGLALLNKG